MRSEFKVNIQSRTNRRLDTQNAPCKALFCSEFTENLYTVKKLLDKTYTP